MTRKIFLLSGLMIFLFSAAGCEYWEDIWDDSKPAPNTPLAHATENQKSYTMKEATDRITHKLIMRFSRYSLPPFIYLPSNAKLCMAVLEELARANAVSYGRTTDNPPVRFEEKINGEQVCFRAVDMTSKKVILEESFCLKQ